VAPRDRDRLEALCRYAARPAVSESRLAELPDGRIGYARKRRYRDGTTAVVMTNAVLMERLCALVPPPRKHLVTCHGALAPAAGLRPKVVPRQTAAGEDEGAVAAAGCRHGASDGGVSEAVGADNAATPATSAIAAVCRQQAERRARARLRWPHPMPLTSDLALGVPSEARLEGSSRTGATWTATLSVPGEPSE
jgi:hypothetical protein